MQDEAVAPAASTQDPIYFPVSTTKLIVMSLCSLGLYQLYWFYQHWKLERNRTGESLSPFWRAFFAPLFAYSLFTRIQEFGQQASLPVGYSAGGLTLAFIVLNVSWRLPDPFWLISMLAFLPLLPVRTAVAAINRGQAPLADTNQRFSAANIMLVLVGIPLVLLGLVATFVPEEALGAL